MADERYSLDGQKAKEVYDREASGQRQSVIDLARKMAELTIPSVMPPDGYEPGDDLPGNNQSIGAQCINSLASNLMFIAFPPTQPMFKLEPVEYRVQRQVDEDPKLWAGIQLALSRLELSHRTRIKSTPLATAYVEYVKLLLIAGNALWRHLKLKEPTYHRPDCYIVKRNSAGLPLLSILKECVSLQSMDADLRDFILDTPEAKEAFKEKKEWEKTAEVYSVCKLKVEAEEAYWCYWQEWEGHVLPGTEVETDFEYPPMWPGWLIPKFGHDWGGSYVEEYRGDHFIVEAHASAINDGSSLAALSLLLVKPGGVTSLKQIREARNLSTLPGNADDLSVFRSEKTADLAFVGENLSKAERRLNAAYLVQFAIQRDGERVTAEEIRRLGQALDKAMGGVYTMIAQGNQRVIIMRAIRLHEEEAKGLPTIPTEVVEVQVITGVDALGNSTDADALRDWAIEVKEAYPLTFEKITDGTNYATRLAAAKGVKPDGLIKKPEQLQAEAQQEQQAAMAQQLIDKGTGPGIKALSDAYQGQAQGA
jgi:hypothetical protein